MYAWNSDAPGNGAPHCASPWCPCPCAHNHRQAAGPQPVSGAHACCRFRRRDQYMLPVGKYWSVPAPPSRLVYVSRARPVSSRLRLVPAPFRLVYVSRAREPAPFRSFCCSFCSFAVGREPEGSVRPFALACLRVSCRLLEVRAACGGGCTFRVLSAPAPSPGSAAVALQQLGLLAPRWRVVGQGSFPCRPPRTCTTSHISVSPSSCDQLVHRFDPVQYPICCICCWPMPTPQHIGALPVQNASLLRCGLVGVARRSERCVR